LAEVDMIFVSIWNNQETFGILEEKYEQETDISIRLLNMFVHWTKSTNRMFFTNQINRATINVHSIR